MNLCDSVSGDICQQFTREMFDMYQGFAFFKNWDFEVLNYSAADYGRLCIPKSFFIFILKESFCTSHFVILFLFFEALEMICIHDLVCEYISK